MDWAWVHGLAVAACDVRWGATQLRLAAEATTSGAKRGANEGTNRGFTSPGLGQSGWLEWALRWKRKREGKKKRKVDYQGFDPKKFRGKEKLFYFQNALWISKPIWILIKVELRMTSTHRIKYKAHINTK
jgi:hypothetical protein